MAHSTYYCHCDQILDPQNVFHTQSHTQHMYVCMCVCACTCKAHIYVCINLQQHHCKSLQYHTAHRSLWYAAVWRNWYGGFYKTAKTNESHPVTHTHTHTHTYTKRTNARMRAHTHTHSLTSNLLLHYWHQKEVHNQHDHYSKAYTGYKSSPQWNSVKVQDWNNMKTHKILLVFCILCIHSHTTVCWFLHRTELSD